MAKQIAEAVVHAEECCDDEEDDNNDVSVDLIDERLYLGNLVAARDDKTREKLQITHILTVDMIPLPRTVLSKPGLTFKYVRMADVPKEDLISNLPETNAFIKESLNSKGTLLVHCYHGVSRSAAVVIAFMMEKYRLCYEDAFTLVKSKRRFVGPNVGFVAQLKLFGHMQYCLDKEDPRYKQFRLKLAGQKLKQVKILPQSFSDLIKPDPGLTQERPDPRVYRCKKCRRVVATHSNIIPHLPKQLKIQLAKKELRPPRNKSTDLNCLEDGQVLIDKLKCLATQEYCADSCRSEGAHDSEGEIIESSIVGRDCTSITCKQMWFVEPMCWMVSVQHEPQGKLTCPQCKQKIGSFSWVMGCKCPCGQKVAPAFYLVPSKVDHSNIVKNVQVTL